MKNYDLNKGLMNRGDIAQSIHSQNQADVLNRNYKKEYENEKTNYEFQKTLAEVPGERGQNGQLSWLPYVRDGP